MSCRNVRCEAPRQRGSDGEHARPAPIARHRAHRAPIRHHCSVALAQDAGDGRIDFPIPFTCKPRLVAEPSRTSSNKLLRRGGAHEISFVHLGISSPPARLHACGAAGNRAKRNGCQRRPLGVVVQACHEKGPPRSSEGSRLCANRRGRVSMSSGPASRLSRPSLRVALELLEDFLPSTFS